MEITKKMSQNRLMTASLIKLINRRERNLLYGKKIQRITNQVTVILLPVPVLIVRPIHVIRVFKWDPKQNRTNI